MKKYQNLDEAIRNEELEQDHLELHDCMKACIEVVASFQFVSKLVRSTLHPPSDFFFFGNHHHWRWHGFMVVTAAQQSKVWWFGKPTKLLSVMYRMHYYA